MDRNTVIAAFALLLIPAYIGTVTALPAISGGGCDIDPSSDASEQVGFCIQVSAEVDRPYYVGLLTLPVYIAGINIDPINQLFLPVLLFIAGFLWYRRPLGPTQAAPGADETSYSYAEHN